MEVLLSKQGWEEKSHSTWIDGITVNESRYGCFGGGDEGREDIGPEVATPEPSEQKTWLNVTYLKPGSSSRS
jgi:hypothetical protein